MTTVNASNPTVDVFTTNKGLSEFKNNISTSGAKLKNVPALKQLNNLLLAIYQRFVQFKVKLAT